MLGRGTEPEQAAARLVGKEGFILFVNILNSELYF